MFVALYLSLFSDVPNDQGFVFNNKRLIHLANRQMPITKIRDSEITKSGVCHE